MAVRQILQPVKRLPAPLRNQVVDSLRDAIATTALKPGDRLIDRELCERFGVSRTTVREALRQLEAERLIANVPNKGLVVSGVTWEEARDIYEVREQLESLAAKLFAERASPEEVHDLVRSVDQFEAELSRVDRVSPMLHAKSSFYATLIAGSQNVLISSILGSLHDRTTMLRAASMTADEHRPAQSLAELRAIVHAIEQRDGAAAAAACAIHVRNAGAAALAHLRLRERGE